MSTILTTSGALLIEGHRPKIAVIDPGASSIILGKNFASKIDKCRSANPIGGDTFVSAGGQEEKCVGRSKELLQFVLAQGTEEETIIEATIIIADTNAYDVILGMDFLGPFFGYIDPLTEEFVWRSDCHEAGKMPTRIARIPACCRAQSSMERRHARPCR